MQLIRFTAGNFKSIADEQTIDFAYWPGESSVPDVPWADVVRPVTVLMGANASGKSNMLDALGYFSRAIRLSATRWQDLEDPGEVMFYPFASESSGVKPSFFELDFVVDGKRYLYGFEYGGLGVEGEWLHYVPNERWTAIFERSDETIEFNNRVVLEDEQAVLRFANPRELYLSVALRGQFGKLGALAQAIVHSLRFIALSDQHREQRIHNVMRALRSGAMNFDDVGQLLAAADTGIVNVTLDESKLPPDLVEKLQTAATSLKQLHPSPRAGAALTISDGDGGVIEFSEKDLEAVALHLIFEHQSEDGTMSLGLREQSDGTVTWFSLATILVEALKTGGVVVVDELDAHLHQHLLFLIVEAFTDTTINVGGAQLFFTSHSTNLLERMQELNLKEQSFWFTEKGSDGKTTVYSLADFRKDSRANYERRYLDGRYRAIPNLSPATLRGLTNANVGG